MDPGMRRGGGEDVTPDADGEFCATGVGVMSGVVDAGAGPPAGEAQNDTEPITVIIEPAPETDDPILDAVLSTAGTGVVPKTAPPEPNEASRAAEPGQAPNASKPDGVTELDGVTEPDQDAEPDRGREAGRAAAGGQEQPSGPVTRSVRWLSQRAFGLRPPATAPAARGPARVTARAARGPR